MTEDKTNCLLCGREILQLTADRRNGMCAPCHGNATRPPVELFAETVFDQIDATLKPFTSFKSALQKLQALPRGYTLCFAFHSVHTDILNGGISQLYSNSTWALILQAEVAASLAGMNNVSTLLREIVYYYHLQGRSKHKLSLAEDYFAELPPTWNKSLKQLDDEYFTIEGEANSVVLSLCRDRQKLFSVP